MKERIRTNWTFTRGLYLLIGVSVIIESAVQQQWFGVLFGGYFASMGLFAFGCAAGNCGGGPVSTGPRQQTNKTIQDVEFEEVKAK